MPITQANINSPGRTLTDQSDPIPRVSVIVAMKRHEASPFLGSLQHQEYESAYEILLVRGGNRSQARNVGIANSRAALIAFIDADCEAPSSWLATLTERVPDDQTIAGVGGVSESRRASPIFERAIDATFSSYFGSLDSPSLISIPETKKQFVKALSGHNCIYRKTILVEFGGFDERFRLNEDTDLCARLRQKGYRLLLDRKIFVYHERRKTVAKFASQFFWYGVGRARSMLTNRRCIDARVIGLFLLAPSLLITLYVLPTVGEAVLLGYLFVVLAASFVGARRTGAINVLPLSASLLVLEHCSYFVGLLLGIFLGPWNEAKMSNSIQVERHVILPRD